MLVRDAKKVCPDVVIVLGEDLTKFRDASKGLYAFIRAFLWGTRIEKLGFDEVSWRMRDEHICSSSEIEDLTRHKIDLPRCDRDD